MAAAPWQPPAPNTLLGWAARYESPQLYTPTMVVEMMQLHYPPGLPYPVQIIDIHKGSRAGNTTNTSYTYDWVHAPDIQRWNITLQDIQTQFPATCAMMYPHPNPMFNQVQHFPIQRPFHQEQGITNLLSATVFTDLARVLWFIWYSANANAPMPPLPAPQLLDQIESPVMTESGSSANIAPDKFRFVPDRATVSLLDPYAHPPAGSYLYPPKPTNRCPGDIKPGYKFRRRWGDFLFTPNIVYQEFERTSANIEFQKVIAQVEFYMTSAGRPDNQGQWQGARHGYIITDEEVVLLRKDDLGNTLISDGFPLRGQFANGHIVSGMAALIYIHLKAARQDWFRVV